MRRFRARIASLDDFSSGVLFSLLGLGALYVAIGYPMGTATRMGPGYLPAVLSGILLVLGIAIMLRSLKLRPDDAEPERRDDLGDVADGAVFSLDFVRPLFFVALALVSFGFLLPRIGLFLSVIVLVLISSFADYKNHFLVAIPLSLALAGTVVLIFVQGLGIPIAVWPRWGPT